VRFLEDGADIPDELIRAVTAGDAMFLSGAGVSFRVGLPSFELLTDQVYSRIGETPGGEGVAARASLLKSGERHDAERFN
jgi:NAD-dependent SIR2 family protein deacetylase